MTSRRGSSGVSTLRGPTWTNVVDVIAFKDGYERALQLDASDAAMTDASYTHFGWKDTKRSSPQLSLGDRKPSLFFLWGVGADI